MIKRIKIYNFFNFLLYYKYEDIKIMEVQLIEVNGQMISLQQFQEMQKNPNIRLKEISSNKYKILEKLEG
jgi:hypothetical protein